MRTLAENEPMLKGDYLAGEAGTIHWDGYTEDGSMARNGRYLLHLMVKDAESTREELKTVVLVK